MMWVLLYAGSIGVYLFPENGSNYQKMYVREISNINRSYIIANDKLAIYQAKNQQNCVTYIKYHTAVTMIPFIK